MHSFRTEAKWISDFAAQFKRSGVGAGTLVALLSETQSRPLIVRTAELALSSLGAHHFQIVMTTHRQTETVPMRSTGASDCIDGNPAVVRALAAAEIVIDCTVEGLLHTRELKEIQAAGARVMMISNEHPEILERLGQPEGLEEAVKRGRQALGGAKSMRVTSAAGTDLVVKLAGATIGGNWGYCTQPGTRCHWPGGLVAVFPGAASSDGRVVLSPGDVNLTFKRYIESTVVLHVESDFVNRIEGSGLDAELMRSYYAAWNDRNAYAVSHVGWGVNPRARWDALAMYDKHDVNGTELRVFEGNFLFSTGANENAGRYTKGHFDLPMRACSISIDGELAVDNGVLAPKLRSAPQ